MKLIFRHKYVLWDRTFTNKSQFSAPKKSSHYTQAIKITPIWMNNGITVELIFCQPLLPSCSIWTGEQWFQLVERNSTSFWWIRDNRSPAVKCGWRIRKLLFYRNTLKKIYCDLFLYYDTLIISLSQFCNMLFLYDYILILHWINTH